MWNDFFLDAAINLEGEIFLIEPVATLLTGVRFKTSLPDTFADVMLRLYTTVRMAPQATGFCRSGRIDLLLAQKYELLQSNSRLLGCERIMETPAEFHFSWVYTFSATFSSLRNWANNDRYRLLPSTPAQLCWSFSRLQPLQNYNLIRTNSAINFKPR